MSKKVSAIIVFGFLGISITLLIYGYLDGTKNNQMYFNSNSITITGNYGTEFDIKEIEQIDLVSDLPSMSRVGGMSSFGVI